MTDNNAQADPANRPAIDENFHFLAYPANILVWASNAEGLCSFVSPSWTTFTGRERAEELGHGWLEKVHPDDREVLVRRLTEARHGQQPFRLMFRYLREDGVVRWFVSQGLPQTTPTDEFIGHLCLCFDVTPYQEGEAAMECSVQNVLPLLKQTRLIAVVLDIHGRVQFSKAHCVDCCSTPMRRCIKPSRAAGQISSFSTQWRRRRKSPTDRAASDEPDP